MSSTAEQYPYVQRDPALGSASLAPLLPITLVGAQRVSVMGLLDTGATVNVLPFQVGEQLGADWAKQQVPVQLSGNLADVDARVLVVPVVAGRFPPVRLAFAWARTDAVPVLLGQVNFFMEFDTCFFRSRGVFEIRPKQG
jgi:hypothetical protein